MTTGECPVFRWQCCSARCKKRFRLSGNSRFQTFPSSRKDSVDRAAESGRSSKATKEMGSLDIPQVMACPGGRQVRTLLGNSQPFSVMIQFQNPTWMIGFLYRRVQEIEDCFIDHGPLRDHRNCRQEHQILTFSELSISKIMGYLNVCDLISTASHDLAPILPFHFSRTYSDQQLSIHKVRRSWVKSIQSPRKCRGFRDSSRARRHTMSGGTCADMNG
jgi:hypothetical protein